MTDIDILVPETKTIKVKDRSYKIGKLSFKQSLSLSRFIAKTILSNREKLTEFAAKSDKSTSNPEDIMNIINLLDDDDLFYFISILLKEDDIAFLNDNLGLENVIEIVTAICEYNDFEKIKKNIGQIKTVFQKTSQKSKAT